MRDGKGSREDWRGGVGGKREKRGGRESVMGRVRVLESNNWLGHLGTWKSYLNTLGH